MNTRPGKAINFIPPIAEQGFESPLENGLDPLIFIYKPTPECRESLQEISDTLISLRVRHDVIENVGESIGIWVEPSAWDLIDGNETYNPFILKAIFTVHANAMDLFRTLSSEQIGQSVYIT